MPRLFAIEEGKGERADAVLCRDLDGFAIGAGHPHRRVRHLHRLGQYVTARHGEILARETWIWLQHHHVGDLLGRLQRHRALLLCWDTKAAELEPRGAFADAEVDPSVGNDIERGEAFCGACRMVVIGNDLADAVA